MRTREVGQDRYECLGVLGENRVERTLRLILLAVYSR